ncbi:MAG: inositol monophosphatase [Candidatus Riflebacteria bacterium HGW-Riflebacteria-2]|nr:MAG: inositol monophosphatase [Candidatus Riflebacteria bacterium HGW-Riflebacteria-2]
MQNLETLSNGAAEVAVAAAELIKKHFNDSHQITFKGTVDLVTEVDVASEGLIRNLLLEKFPDIRFHGEENGGEDWCQGQVWVVDPLDGTTNFANRLPHFSVSIALCHDGQPVAGAIVNPMNGEVYRTWQGGGAWLNNNRIFVSKVDKLNEALAVTGYPYNRRECLDELLRHLGTMLQHVQCVRRLGSAALDLCYIARGIFSIYWETNLKPWDIAAGRLLVSEAGGLVTRFDGSHMYLDSYELLATNRILHAECIRLLTENRAE